MKLNTIKKVKGVYTVEFVMVSALFLLTVFMIMEVIRYMYLMNAASEITRRGARTAVVCDYNAAGIVDEMASRFPNLTVSNVNISYLPAGCDQSNCQTVTVALTGLTTTIIGLSLNIPDFSTTLPRESMDSTLNPLCT